MPRYDTPEDIRDKIAILEVVRELGPKVEARRRLRANAAPKKRLKDENSHGCDKLGCRRTDPCKQHCGGCAYCAGD